MNNILNYISEKYLIHINYNEKEEDQAAVL